MTMTTEERRASLRTAARLVRAVADSLNDKAHPCPACGLNVKEAFEEALIKEQLDGIHRKLDRFATSDFRKKEDDS